MTNARLAGASPASSFTRQNVELGMLYNALDDAIEGMEQMLPYVDEYYAQRYDFISYIERAKNVLAVSESTFQL